MHLGDLVTLNSSRIKQAKIGYKAVRSDPRTPLRKEQVRISQLQGGTMEAHRAVSSPRRSSAPQDATEKGAGMSQLPGKGIRESLAQVMGCNAPASAGDRL